MIREITFGAKVDDFTGNLSLSRSADRDDLFTSLEMIGILETMKNDILREQFPKPATNAKKKKSTNKS